MKAPALNEKAKGQQRFEYLIKTMDNDNVDLKIALMQLINAILSGEDSVDLDQTLLDLKIPETVDQLRKGQTKEALLLQLDVYDASMLGGADGFEADGLLLDSEYVPSPPPLPYFKISHTFR